MSKEKKEIIRKNGIIAAFMSLEDTGMSVYLPSEYKYHSSWDWLMAVVAKIEDYSIVASFQIENPTIYIWASSEDEIVDIEVDVERSKIDAVYKACLQFIEVLNTLDIDDDKD